MNEADSQESLKAKKILIPILNLLLLTIYTVILSKNRSAGNILADAIFIVVHILICLILAIFAYRKEFLLSAAAILLIGFSTCWIAFS